MKLLANNFEYYCLKLIGLKYLTFVLGMILMARMNHFYHCLKLHMIQPFPSGVKKLVPGGFKETLDDIWST